MFLSHRDVFYTKTDYAMKKPENELETEEFTIYHCTFCDAGYSSESDIDIHRKKKHKRELQCLAFNKKKFVCTYCVYEFPNKSLLLKHIKVEHLMSSPDADQIERDIFICNECSQLFFNKTFLTVHMLRRHMRRVQNDKRPYKFPCPKCDKIIKLKSSWHHFQLHCFQSVSCCPICLTKQKNKKVLMSHLEQHPKTFTCRVCSYETKKKTIYAAHMTKHSGALNDLDDATTKRRVYQYFVPRTNLWEVKFHFTYGLKGLTLDRDLKVCILCRHIAWNEASMEYHVRKSHITEEAVVVKRRNVCSCGEEFFNKILLKHHVFKMKGDHRETDSPMASESRLEVLPQLQAEESESRQSQEAPENIPQLGTNEEAYRID